MTRIGWGEKSREPRWLRKFLINGVGCVFTALILTLTVTLKFDEGGWVTVAITGGVVAVCYLVRRHYRLVTKAVDQLGANLLPEIFAAATVKAPARRDPNAPTAVLLVNGFNGLGLATLMKIPPLFHGQFPNAIFFLVATVTT